MSRIGNLARSLTVAFLLSLLTSFSHIAIAQTGFRWVDNPEAGTCDLFLGEQPALRYMSFTNTSMPEGTSSRVYHHVFGPGTKTLITNGPDGLYPHHRGMFVGWTRTSFDGKTENFWSSSNGPTQQHVEFIERTANADAGSMTARIHWKDREGKLVIDEVRKLTVRRLATDSPPGYGWTIDWTSTLNSRRGTIQMDGDRQHAGFHFRAAAPVAVANGARYIRPAGFPQQPEAIEVNDKTDPNGHIDLGWLAMYYELEGQRFIVEYHEAPNVPRPSRYSERPYGRFGAFYPVTLEEGRPFTMNYAVVVTSGPLPTAAAIQARHDEFRKRVVK